jgi:hypothetical protein
MEDSPQREEEQQRCGRGEYQMTAEAELLAELGAEARMTATLTAR